MEFGEPKYCRGTPEVVYNEKGVRRGSGLTTALQKDRTEITNTPFHFRDEVAAQGGQVAQSQ